MMAGKAVGGDLFPGRLACIPGGSSVIPFSEFD